MSLRNLLVGLGAVAWMTASIPATSAAPTNLALGRPVTGSGFFDGVRGEVFPFDNVVDGRLNDTGTAGDWSFWLTPDRQTGFFTVDLEAIRLITAFELQNTHNRSFDDRATKDFHIDLSVDGAVFDTVLTGVLPFDVDDPIEILAFDVPDREARFVRFHVDSFHEPKGPRGGGLNEIRVLGVGQVPEPSATAVWTVLALLGAAVAARRRRPG